MFTGFSDKTVDFFWQIRFNNDREWFHAHKEEFQQAVMMPTKALADALFDWITEQHPGWGLNLHISRIYRDARRLFGRGPLKDHLWFSFQNEIESRDTAPCFWFELGCEGYGYGMGSWMTPAMAARYRRLIDAAPEKMDALARKFDGQNVFALSGERYARSKGHDAERIAGWYNRKNLSLCCDRPYDGLSYSRALLDTVKDGFRFLTPYYEFLDQAYRSAD